MKPTSVRVYLGVTVAILLGNGESFGQNRFGPQPTPPFNPQQSRPIVSPYLNLLRPGGSAAFNYYTLVRPQLEFQQSLNNVQAQVLQNRQTLTELSQTRNDSNFFDLPPTSNVPAFLNTGGYFNGGANRGGSIGGTAGPRVNPGGGGAAQPRGTTPPPRSR